MTSLFLLATSLSLLAIFQHNHRVSVHRITTSDYSLCIFILFLHILHIPHQKTHTHGNRDNKQSTALKEDKGFFCYYCFRQGYTNISYWVFSFYLLFRNY